MLYWQYFSGKATGKGVYREYGRLIPEAILGDGCETTL